MHSSKTTALVLAMFRRGDRPVYCRRILGRPLISQNGDISNRLAQHGKIIVGKQVAMSSHVLTTLRISPLLNSLTVRSHSTDRQRRRANREHLSLYDMDAGSILTAVETPKEMEILVSQLEAMENLSQADVHALIKPMVGACRKFRKKEMAADLAERILFDCLARIPSDIAERFEENHDCPRAFHPPYPDNAVYTKVMSVVGNSKTEEAALRVNRLFRLMTTEYRAEASYLKQRGDNHSATKSAGPSLGTLKTMLRSWYVTETALGAMEAEKVLVEMEQLSNLRSDFETESHHLSSQLHLKPPDTECYNMVLSAYSRVDVNQHPLVFDRARSLFRRIQQLEHDNRDVRVDWFTLHALVQCIQSKLDSMTEEESLDDACIEELLQVVPLLLSVPVYNNFLGKFQRQGVHPRAWALGVVLEAIVHGPASITRLETADMFLGRMVGEIPFDSPTASENNLLPELWPSQGLLISLVGAWRKSQLPNAELVIERIQSIAVQSNYPQLYATHLAMKKWERSLTSEAVFVVESFLDRLLEPASDFEPTGETFAIVMRTWTTSNRGDRGLMVEQLMKRMQDLQTSVGTDLVPRETHFGLVLETWLTLSGEGQKYPGKHGLLYPAQHACRHLDDIVQSRPAWVDSNNKHYSSCLKAWTRQNIHSDDSDEILPAREAAKLLDQLEYQSGTVPPAPHCNMVLHCCLRDDALLNHKQEVYEIAMNTFNKGSHDSASYVLAVDIVKRTFETLEQNHLQFIESIVLAARDAGRLTQALVYEAVEVLWRDQLKRLFHFSDSYAEMIEQKSSEMLHRPEGKRLVWEAPVPRGLKLLNLPRSWSRKNEFSKSYKKQQQRQKHSQQYRRKGEMVFE